MCLKNAWQALNSRTRKASLRLATDPEMLVKNRPGDFCILWADVGYCWFRGTCLPRCLLQLCPQAGSAEG